MSDSVKMQSASNQRAVEKVRPKQYPNQMSHHKQQSDRKNPIFTHYYHISAPSNDENKKDIGIQCDMQCTNCGERTTEEICGDKGFEVPAQEPDMPAQEPDMPAKENIVPATVAPNGDGEKSLEELKTNHEEPTNEIDIDVPSGKPTKDPDVAIEESQSEMSPEKQNKEPLSEKPPEEPNAEPLSEKSTGEPSTDRNLSTNEPDASVKAVVIGIEDKNQNGEPKRPPAKMVDAENRIIPEKRTKMGKKKAAASEEPEMQPREKSGRKRRGPTRYGANYYGRGENDTM